MRKRKPLRTVRLARVPLHPRGRWPFRRTWFSVCLHHEEPKWGCPMCRTGRWSYDTPRRLMAWINWLRGRPRLHVPAIEVSHDQEPEDV